MEYLSQKQIAEKLGYSKQKVYRCIKANHIKEAVTEVVKGNNVLMYDEVAVKQIESLIHGGYTVTKAVHREAVSEVHQKSSEVHHEAVNDTLLKQLEILNEQLKVKDEQLKNKDKQIEDLTTALANVSEGLKAAQVLQANAEKKVLELEEKKKEEVVIVAEPTEPTKKHWWNILRKN